MPVRSAAASSVPSSARAGEAAAFMRRTAGLQPGQEEASAAIVEHRTVARDLLDQSGPSAILAPCM